jgi:hypothetical protein
LFCGIIDVWFCDNLIILIGLDFLGVKRGTIELCRSFICGIGFSFSSSIIFGSFFIRVTKTEGYWSSCLLSSRSSSFGGFIFGFPVWIGLSQLLILFTTVLLPFWEVLSSGVWLSLVFIAVESVSIEYDGSKLKLFIHYSIS